MLLLTLAAVGMACNDDVPKPIAPTLQATEVPNLDATSTTKYTLFSFESGLTVANADSASTKWDIGFRGTTLIVNSGVSGPGAAGGQIVDGIFDELAVAPASGFAQDSETEKAIKGSGGWYTYTGTASSPNHAILPNAGKVIVVKTATGKYAKMEIISYYINNPSTTTAEFADLTTRPESRYYTFRYLYQPDGSTNLEATEE